MFDKKVTDSELTQKLESFAEGLGLKWYHFSEQLVGYSNKAPEIVREIERLDRDDDRIINRVAEVEDKLDLLLEFLGLEYDEEPRIVKKKKGKK